MFDQLSDKLGKIFEGLTKRGALKEADVDAALKEVRAALIDADVALPVAKDFIAKIRARAIGQEVLRSVTPGQMVIKIVHDELAALLGGEAADAELMLHGEPPAVVMMVGLQGSGKTTTSAKLAKRLSEKDKKRVMMASLDVQRPAAQEQLRVLGEQASIATLPVIAGQMPVAIVERALTSARLQGFDVLILDTAGRLHVDEALMSELAAVRAKAKPAEILLVADALTGQDAVNVAKAFDDKIGITGTVLTRLDGDGRGGAALSLRHVTGKAIKFAGVGEKLDQLERFDPQRVAGRILGMGDIVGLVEKAQQVVEQDDAEKLAKRMAKGEFNLDDLRSQLGQMRKMGGMQGLMGMLPGMGKLAKQVDPSRIDDKNLARQEAIIGSMTPKERRHPKLINASRKKRIAAGAGMAVQDVNKILKMHKDMETMMKRMKKMGMRGLMSGLPGAPGAMPPGMGNFLPKR